MAADGSTALASLSLQSLSGTHSPSQQVWNVHSLPFGVMTGKVSGVEAPLLSESHGMISQRDVTKRATTLLSNTTVLSCSSARSGPTPGQGAAPTAGRADGAPLQLLRLLPEGISSSSSPRRADPRPAPSGPPAAAASLEATGPRRWARAARTAGPCRSGAAPDSAELGSHRPAPLPSLPPSRAAGGERDPPPPWAARRRAPPAGLNGSPRQRAAPRALAPPPAGSWGQSRSAGRGRERRSAAPPAPRRAANGVRASPPPRRRAGTPRQPCRFYGRAVKRGRRNTARGVTAAGGGGAGPERAAAGAGGCPGAGAARRPALRWERRRASRAARQAAGRRAAG